MTLLLDFDGTLNPGPYTTRYKCNGVPTPEAKAAVKAYRDAGIEVIIFTARLADAMTMQRARIEVEIQRWTAEHFDGWTPSVTCAKYPGVILDDNAIRFDGKNWPTVEQIKGHGTFTSPDDYKPAPDYKQAFLGAMALAEGYFKIYHLLQGHPVDAADYREIQRLRALRDAAKGE